MNLKIKPVEVEEAARPRRTHNFRPKENATPMGDLKESRETQSVQEFKQVSQIA